MNRHTARWDMPKSKIAITLDRAVLTELDELIAQRRFPNRSQAIEDAIVEKLERMARTRLAAELDKLDPGEEKARAEEGLRSELVAWPEYREETSAGPTSAPHAVKNRPANDPCWSSATTSSTNAPAL